MTWNKQQIASFAKEIRRRHSGGWPYLVPEVRSAIVEAKVLSIVRLQASETITIAAVDELTALMHAEMGTAQ